MQYTFYYDDNEHVVTLPEIFSIIKNNPNKEYKKKCDDKWITINNKLVCTTQFICHRINTIDELKHINHCWGVEIDIRDKNDTLVLSHDPYKNGDVLEEYLREYKHALLILNIKSERVELDCLPLLEKYNIQNYFFLDSTFPMTYLLYKKHNIINNASRFSEFEPFELTENINHMIKWVWVDCFSILPLTKHIVEKFGVDAEIVDLRTLMPWDQEAVEAAVKKTGKAIVFHEDTFTGGIGAEIAAHISQICFEHLDAPVIRVGSLDTPVPLAKHLEDQFLPQQRFEDALKKLMEY